MGMCMRGSFTRGSVMGAGCIVFLGRGDMKGIGLMGSMTGMGSRAGRGGVDTGDSTTRDCGMGSGCIGSIMRIAMPGSGSVGRAMGPECKLAPMVAAMWGNSNVELSMVLAATVSGNNFSVVFRFDGSLSFLMGFDILDQFMRL